MGLFDRFRKETTEEAVEKVRTETTLKAMRWEEKEAKAREREEKKEARESARRGVWLAFRGEEGVNWVKGEESEVGAAEEDIREATPLPGSRRPFAERLERAGERAGSGISRAAGAGQRAVEFGGVAAVSGMRKAAPPVGKALWAGTKGATKYAVGRPETVRGRRVQPRRIETLGKAAARGTTWATSAPGAKRLTVPSASKEMYEVSPRTMAIAQAPGMVGAGQMHHADLSGLRQLTMPRGLNRPEQAVWEEVRANGDIDTKRNIVADLRQQGFSSRQAETAIGSLATKGYIQPTGQQFQGSPEYAIAPGR